MGRPTEPAPKSRYEPPTAWVNVAWRRKYSMARARACGRLWANSWSGVTMPQTPETVMPCSPSTRSVSSGRYPRSGESRLPCSSTYRTSFFSSRAAVVASSSVPNPQLLQPNFSRGSVGVWPRRASTNARTTRWSWRRKG